MARKKFVLYGSMIFVFLVFCGIYICLMRQSVDEVYQQRINERITSSALQIDKYLEYKSKDLVFDVKSLNISSGDINQILPEIKKLENEGYKQSGETLYILQADGSMFDMDGNEAESPIDKGVLRTAQNKGYAVTSMSDLGSDVQDMAVVVPIDQTLYLVEENSINSFIGELADNLTFNPRYINVYDEWGNPVSGGVYPDGGEDAEIGKTVTDGAAVFTSNRNQNLFQKTGMNQNYNIFIGLSQPKSWFIGARADFHEDYPMFSGIIRSSAILFFSWLLLVLVIIVLDIMNDRENKRSFFLVSHIDQLTGLINNAGMDEAMTDFMQKSPIKDYSIVCFDIVAFSRINNMFGYSMGDTLLRVIADVIQRNYFAGVRLSADRFSFFAISAPSLTDEIKTKFLLAVKNEMGEEYVQLVAFKFGVYPMNDGHTSCREAYECAHLALKEAKKASSQTEVVYDSNLHQLAQLRRNIELNMMHALSKEEFVVYIHPQFLLENETCSRGEALVRWQSEFMGFLPPDKFIPLFESNGFIVEIDFFMLTSVLQLLQQRMEEGKKMVTVAVNQSKVTISFPNYFERLKALVSRFTVPLRYVELEVTESALENDMATIVPLIHSIKKLGFKVSLDDFGSGFSSLNTLRLLPIDVLKIDRAFLQESGSSARSKTIITNVVNMAKEMDIVVVCEGVETKDQLDFLRQTGCDIIQGFYYSKPIPYQEFLDVYIDKKDDVLPDESCT